MMWLADLCKRCGATLRRDAPIRSLGFVEIPLEGRLVFAIDQKNLERARGTSGIAGIMTTEELSQHISGDGPGVAITADPRRKFVELHNLLVEEGQFYGEPVPTIVHPTAEIHPKAHIDDYAVTIGAGCRIDAGAIVLRGTQIGPDAHVMSGSVLGSAGFQTMRFEDAVIDFRHAGSIEIGARTVVMANAVIARAVFLQATRIGDDCRIGNGAFVSHNVQICDRTLVGHGAVVAGNVNVGRGVTLGPGAICLDRLKIGDGAFITAGAVVTRPVEDNQRVSGNFAISHARYLDLVKAAAAGSFATEVGSEP